GDQVRNDLRKTGLMALAGRLSADDDVDMSVDTNLELGLLPWRADRRLNAVCEPESEKFAAPLCLAPSTFEAVPVGELHGEVHVLLVPPAVVEHANGVSIGHGFRPHQIAPTQGDAVDAQFSGCHVDKALEREGDLRTT